MEKVLANEVVDVKKNPSKFSDAFLKHGKDLIH
jgi:hypothetical protein